MPFEQLRAKFADLHIDVTRPGFYDAPEFLTAERAEPTFLELYNEFVVEQAYDDAYLVRSRKRIRQLTAFMSRELKADGREGACVDVTGVMMRILEREEIWCCMFKGGLSIEYPGNARLPAQVFRPLMHPDNPAVTGHAWLYAPPFKILDVTLAQQPGFQPEQAALLPALVEVENVEQVGSVTLGELVDPELMALAIKQLRRRPSFDQLVSPTIRAHMLKYPPLQCSVGGVTLKYFSTSVSAANLPLAEMRNLTLCGRLPSALADAFLDECPVEDVTSV